MYTSCTIITLCGFPKDFGKHIAISNFYTHLFHIKNNKLHNIFSCVHQTSMKSNDKLIVVEVTFDAMQISGGTSRYFIICMFCDLIDGDTRSEYECCRLINQ